MPEIERVIVVGAGTMGSQIALQTAYSGRYQVALVDADAAQLKRADDQNRKLVARGVEKGRLTQEQAEAALRSTEATADLAAAAAKADLTIQAVSEHLDAKRKVFQALERRPARQANLGLKLKR